jgi:hypothetical protein
MVFRYHADRLLGLESPVMRALIQHFFPRNRPVRCQ